jgi:hypothetical protein
MTAPKPRRQAGKAGSSFCFYLAVTEKACVKQAFFSLFARQYE